jgi:hypothetical protein
MSTEVAPEHVEPPDCTLQWLQLSAIKEAIVILVVDLSAVRQAPTTLF